MAKKMTGTALLSLEKRREMASKGGKAAHQQGVAHQWTSEKARDAGRKGGKAFHVTRGRTSMVPVGVSEDGSGIPDLGGDAA